MVPEDWGHFSLGDLLDFKNGYNTEKANYGGGIPFINVSEVLKHESLIASQIPGSVRLSDTAAAAYRVRRGDVLFNRTSETTEEVGFTSVYLSNDPVIFGGFVIRGRPKKNMLHPEFSSYALRQPMVRSEIVRRSQGAVRSNIGQTELSKVRINLPPLPEQRKIAEILSTWDKAIETSEALLATARTQKRALMQTLLTGKRRFPEFEGQEWRVEKLVEHFEFINGRAFKPDDWGNTGLPIIRIQNLTGSTDAVNYYAGSVDEKHLVHYGDFLLSWSATLDTFIWQGTSAVLNQHIFKVVPHSDTLKMFGFHLISYEIGKLTSKVHGTSMKHITKKDLAKIDASFPSIPEQTKITQVLDAAQSEIDEISADIEKLRTEKKALMQQLLTGKRRVQV